METIGRRVWIERRSFFGQTLQRYLGEKHLGFRFGQVFCAPSDFGDNLFPSFARDQSGLVGLLSTHVGDISVGGDPSIYPAASRLLALRFGVLKSSLDVDDTSTRLAHRGLEITRPNDGSPAVSRNS